MPLWDVVTPYLALAGIAVLTITMILRLREQYRREAARQAQRNAACDDSIGCAGGRRGVPQQPSRLMRQEVPFSGADTAANSARHELEIDALGRQIIGQINSKMVALQTLTLEAERAAHRIEILLERLEQFATTPATAPIAAPAVLPTAIHAVSFDALFTPLPPREEVNTSIATSDDANFLQDYGFSPEEIRSRLSRKMAA